MAGRGGVPRLGYPGLEQPRVDVLAGRVQAVAAAVGLDRGGRSRGGHSPAGRFSGGKRGAQPGHGVAHLLDRGPGRVVRPRGVDQPAHGNHPPGVQHQHGQDRALPQAPERQHDAPRPYFETAENAEFHTAGP
jgi:hypothetical protein